MCETVQHPVWKQGQQQVFHKKHFGDWNLLYAIISGHGQQIHGFCRSTDKGEKEEAAKKKAETKDHSLGSKHFHKQRLWQKTFWWKPWKGSQCRDGSQQTCCYCCGTTGATGNCEYNLTRPDLEAVQVGPRILRQDGWDVERVVLLVQGMVGQHCSKGRAGNLVASCWAQWGPSRTKVSNVAGPVPGGEFAWKRFFLIRRSSACVTMIPKKHILKMNLGPTMYVGGEGEKTKFSGYDLFSV